MWEPSLANEVWFLVKLEGKETITFLIAQVVGLGWSINWYN